MSDELEKFGSAWGSATDGLVQPESQTTAKKRSVWAWSALAVFIFLVGAGLAYYLVFVRAPSVKPIAVDIVYPENIAASEPFRVNFSASNSADRQFSDVKITITLPDGLYFADKDASQRFLELSLGDILPGGTRAEDVSLVALADNQAVTHIDTKTSYALGNRPDIRFEYKLSRDIPIQQPLLDFTIESPRKVLVGEPFTARILYRNTGSRSFVGANIRLTLPDNYRLISIDSNPTSSTGTIVVSLGDLAPNKSGAVQISGSMDRDGASFSALSASLTADVSGKDRQMRKQTAEIEVQSSPLVLNLSLANGNNFVAHPGDQLDYEINYENKAGVALDNVVITASLNSEMIDFHGINSNGVLDSANKTITWSSKTSSNLSPMPADAKGSLNFTVLLKPFYPAQKTTKDLPIKISVSAVSPTVPPDLAAQKTFASASKETKLGGKISFLAIGYKKEPTAKVVNSGPFPPRAEQTTQYTIHWIVSTTASEFNNVVVSATLPPFARCTDKKTVPIGSLDCDADTGLVSWRVGTMPANRGFAGEPPLEAVFQIENKPAANQVGQYLIIIGESKLVAQDPVSGLSTDASTGAITSLLPDDLKATSEDRRVIP